MIPSLMVDFHTEHPYCVLSKKIHVICIMFTCLHLDLPYANLRSGQREPRNVVACQATIELYLLALPKRWLPRNNQKIEILFYKYPAFDLKTYRNVISVCRGCL